MDQRRAPSTVGSALSSAVERLRLAGSETPRLDAELLLGSALGVERTAILAHPEAPIGDGPAEVFSRLLGRRVAGEPVAYIRGMKEFHGLALAVDPRVLIPRPETETLVDLALGIVRTSLTERPRAADAPPYLVWDVGTGSGAIAIALAGALRRLRYLSDVRFHLTDLSESALEVATENAVGHGLADRMTFMVSDLLATVSMLGRADLVVANLPYIPTATLPLLPIAAGFEPEMALDGGPDGLDLVRRLLRELGDGGLASGGHALLEIGSDQAEPVRVAAVEALPGWRLAIHPDLSGLPRVAQLDAPAA